MRVLILIAVALLLTVPLPLQAATAPDAPVAHADKEDACSEPAGPDSLPVVGTEGLDARLASLYALYEDLPGFVDVHFLPEGPVQYTALFEGAVPASAQRVDTPVPVALQELPTVAPVAPLATDEAGTDTPGLNDILCNGIRPGARITIGNAICTLSFLYTDGSRVYATTAGHCISTGQTASITQGGTFGKAVYSIDSGVGKDFAIIEVYASKHHLVDPAMCDYGGPEFEQSSSIFALPVIHTGHGLGLVSAPPRAKSGVGTTWGHTSFLWYGSAVPGDSGSAIQTGLGGSLGSVTHLVVGFTLGNNAGTRATTALDNAGYGHLELMTAPLHTS